MPLPRNDDVDIDYLIRKNWWKKVDVKGEDDCWPWLQSVGGHGYGQTWDGVTVRLAHRVAWSLRHGEQVPTGMTIDHECHNQICCNPLHLRVKTNVDNATDQGQRDKTHCPEGHPYDTFNTYVDPKGHRRCRCCAREKKAAWTARRKALQLS
jgi:hypothetical protein